MKSYIFLTPNIFNVGGAQIYLKYKSEWLIDKGYKVIIISSIKSKYMINGLEKYKDFVVEGLFNYPHWFYKRKRKRIENILLNIIGDKSDEMIIESTSITVAVWGEIIAKYYNAKHLVYSLQENNEVFNPEIFNFLKFKNIRRELAGINPQSIPRIFKYESNNGPYLRAYTLNIPEDYDYSLVNKIAKADYTIASIGRLEKPFVLPLIKEIISFAQMHDDKSFILLMIGGSENKTTEKILKIMVKKTSNIKLYITGFIYPIPLKLLQIPNVFISSSGACSISSQQKKLTISIDARDHKPIGIIGITTNNRIFRDGEPEIELPVLLKAILIDKKYQSFMINDGKPLSIVDYSDHFEFINKSDNKKEYYNFEMLVSMKKYKRFIFNLIGYGRLRHLSNYKNALRSLLGTS